MKRRGFTWIEGLVILVAVIIVAAIVLPVYTRYQENLLPSCQSNQRPVAIGFLQYIQDWDEKFPQVNVRDAAINDKNPFGWADALQPYLKSTQVFHCPQRQSNRNRKPNESGYTDYFYNRRLAGIRSNTIKFPAAIILTGDGNDGTDATNARYSLSTLPTTWRKNKSSPAYFHFEGAYYSFADGHVKWLKPDNVTGAKPNGNNATFAIR